MLPSVKKFTLQFNYMESKKQEVHLKISGLTPQITHHTSTSNIILLNMVKDMID
jgi:hypothetical protein